MDQHPGDSKHDPSGKNTGNSRNGKSRKPVRSFQGDLEREVPRDRQGACEPQLVKNGEKPLNGFDDRILN